MNRKKAFVCTVLLWAVIMVALIGSLFIKSGELTMYIIIANVMMFIYIGELLDRFYKWLRKYE